MQMLIKDQLNQIQKLMNKIKQLSSEVKNNENMSNTTNYQSNKIVSQLIQLHQSNKKNNQMDEYRIIALQAAAI